MSLTTPTTTAIAGNIVANLSSSLSQTIPLLPKAFSRVMAKAQAGVFVLLYKYIGFTFLQIFVEHASAAETTVNGKTFVPLQLWGRLIGEPDRTAATKAEMNITVTVDTQGDTLDAQTQMVRAESGYIYHVVAPVALDAATVTVAIIAASDQAGGNGAGEDGTLVPGDIVSFVNPIAAVQRDATVLAVTTEGADAETVASYRRRIVLRFQRRPQGGAYADYDRWGKTVAGIVNVYPYTGFPGEVDVYVEATVASSGSAYGIPTTAQLAAVEAAINLDVSGTATRRPVNAAVNALAITRKVVDLTVTGMTAQDLPAAKTQLETGLAEYLYAREPHIVGLSTLPRLDRITQAALAGICDDVVSAVGGGLTSVVMEVDSTIEQIYTLGEGEKARLGTVTYL